MVDFHTHILPEMDDGATGFGESLTMYDEQANQGVKAVVASSHFYVNQNTIDEFIEKRNTIYFKIKDEMKKIDKEFPRTILAAEVRLFSGISKLENLEKLCVGNSRCMLLELPYSNWSEKWVFYEIYSIIFKREIVPIIVHPERYILKSDDYKVLQNILALDLFVQVNSSSFFNSATRKTVKKLIKDGKVHLVASDCHNMTVRKPILAHTMNYIQKKFGKDLKKQLIKNSYDFLTI